MRVSQRIEGLEFDNDTVFDHEVGAINNPDIPALVSGMNGYLTLKLQSALSQFNRQCAGVSALQQADAQHALHLDRGTDDRMRKVIKQILIFLSRPSRILCVLRVRLFGIQEPPMKLLMIDNYDSFTYNIVQYLGELGADLQVRRNDTVTVAEIEALAPARIVISPGPGHPSSAGISVDLIRRLADRVPILGVCLGHQAIGAAFGGSIVRAKTQMHGKTSLITTTQQGVFAGLPEQFTVNRYHSLVIDRASCPPELEITATSEDGEIQGVRHRSLDVEGVQFHPESILTEHGHAMLANFLKQP